VEFPGPLVFLEVTAFLSQSCIKKCFHSVALFALFKLESLTHVRRWTMMRDRKKPSMFWLRRNSQARLKGRKRSTTRRPLRGRAHVGALRGPLIHDAIYRTLKAKGVPARYLVSVWTITTPVDEIPYGEVEHFEKYLGAPLCATHRLHPARKRRTWPTTTSRNSFSVFGELGIRPGILSNARHLSLGPSSTRPLTAILAQARCRRPPHLQGSQRRGAR